MTELANRWQDRFHDQFHRETDRAAVIVSAAMMDAALELLLQRLLVGATNIDHSLIGNYRAPLGSFSAKIDAAHQLGLISAYMARDLHLIRGLRNDFSHKFEHLTFDTPTIRDRVRALEGASDYNRRNPAMRASFGPPGPRLDFLGCAAWMLYALHCALDDVKPLKVKGPEFGYVDWDSLPAEVQKLLKETEGA